MRSCNFPDTMDNGMIAKAIRENSRSHYSVWMRNKNPVNERFRVRADSSGLSDDLSQISTINHITFCKCRRIIPI